MPNKNYDLEERTAVFGENVIDFLKSINASVVNKPLVSQLVRSASSIGANYGEADSGVSKKDFRNKIGTCRKESKETKHWLRMRLGQILKEQMNAELFGKKPMNLY
jgi:four helix bundle protein